MGELVDLNARRKRRKRHRVNTVLTLSRSTNAVTTAAPTSGTAIPKLTLRSTPPDLIA